MAIFNQLLRSLASFTVPGKTKARLTVLLYHRVLQSLDPLLPAEPDAAGFDAQVALLSSVFNILPLNQALIQLRQGSLPPRALGISFDDGYRDNVEIALPILRRHGATATFFIASGLLDGGRMMHDTVIETLRRLPAQRLDLEWLGLGQLPIGDAASRLDAINRFVGKVKYLPFNERLEACNRLGSLSPTPLPERLMMTSDEVRQLKRAGMHIGGHTRDHPILAKVDTAEATRQICADREALAGLLGSAPDLFAYPNGKPGLDYHAEHVAMVKAAGYSAAVSVSFGSTSAESDHFQIPRFNPWDRNPKRLVMRLLAHPMRHRVPVMA